MPRCRRCSPRWPAGCSWRGWGRPRSCIWRGCSGRRRSIRWPGSGGGRRRGRRRRGGGVAGGGGAGGWGIVVVMFAVAAAACSFFLRRLRAGAFIQAIGDNPFAARATGLPTRPMVLLEYMLAALIGLFAGVVMAASINSMPTRIFNSTMIYDVVLVVVLGGIGLSGGRGGVFNVVIGTLLIGTMLNGM